MNWAWEQRLEPSTKLVLLALADIADDSGHCWPSVSMLSKKVHASERNVRRILHKLRSDSKGRLPLVCVDERRRSNGSQRSNVYMLQMQTDKLSVCEKQGRGDDTRDREGLTQLCQGEGDTGDTPGADIAMSPLEPPIEPPPEPKRRTTRPRPVDKTLSAEVQQQLARELSKLDSEAQGQLFSQLATGLRHGSIKHPAAWTKAAVSRINNTRGNKP